MKGGPDPARPPGPAAHCSRASVCLGDSATREPPWHSLPGPTGGGRKERGKSLGWGLPNARPAPAPIPAAPPRPRPQLGAGLCASKPHVGLCRGRKPTKLKEDKPRASQAGAHGLTVPRSQVPGVLLASGASPNTPSPTPRPEPPRGPPLPPPSPAAHVRQQRPERKKGPPEVTRGPSVLSPQTGWKQKWLGH